MELHAGFFLQLTGYLPFTFAKLFHGQLVMLSCIMCWKWFLVIKRPCDSGKKDPSMPSSHSAHYFFLALYFQNKIPLYIIALFISISRVFHRDHTIKDIVIGAMLGSFCGYQWRNYQIPLEDENSLQVWNLILFIVTLIFHFLFKNSNGYNEGKLELAYRWLSSNGWVTTYIMHGAIALMSTNNILFYPIFGVAWNFSYEIIEVFSPSLRYSRWHQSARIYANLFALAISLWVAPSIFNFSIVIFIFICQFLLQRFVYTDNHLRIALWIQLTCICLSILIYPLPIRTQAESTQRMIIVVALFLFLSDVGLMKGSWERRKKSLLQFSLCLSVIILETLIIIQYLYLSTIPLQVNLSLTCLYLVFYTFYDSGIKEIIKKE